MQNKHLATLIASMDKEKMAALFIAPSEEMTFLFGQSPSLCERFQGMFITGKGELFYICNLLYREEIVSMFGDFAEIYSWFDGDGFTGLTDQVLRKYNLLGKTIGVNSAARAADILQITQTTAVIFVSGITILEETRLLKSTEELENLQQSAKYTDEAYLELTGMIKAGQSERDIMQMLSKIYQNKGLEQSHGIIASGSNSAYPHYSSDQRIIQEKDIIIIDLGCIYNHMCSDLTRTLFVGGITDKEKQIYDIVLEAITAAEDLVAEGVYIPEIDQAARDIIEKAGYGRYFNTRLGHGIGYAIHEAPDIKKNNPRNLQKGMAFSIEPGIYLPGEFGIRIEDIVTITAEGAKILNRVPKTVTVINN